VGGGANDALLLTETQNGGLRGAVLPHSRWGGGGGASDAPLLTEMVAKLTFTYKCTAGNCLPILEIFRNKKCFRGVL